MRDVRDDLEDILMRDDFACRSLLTDAQRSDLQDMVQRLSGLSGASESRDISALFDLVGDAMILRDEIQIETGISV